MRKCVFFFISTVSVTTALSEGPFKKTSYMRNVSVMAFQCSPQLQEATKGETWIGLSVGLGLHSDYKFGIACRWA